MSRRALCGLGVALALLLPGIAPAQVVTVTSGEHDGFTRIALDFGRPVDWQMGRATDGYTLRVAAGAPEYDLTAVYQLIGRDRISALWVDPGNGDLHFGIGCACYAMPFAFRPSIVVVDIKNGKPPRESAFEQVLAKDPHANARGAAQDAALTGPMPRPPSPGSAPAYDWIGARMAPDPAAAPAQPDMPVTAVPVDIGLEPLRKALIEEMSRGAAAGLIDLTLPRKPEGGMIVGIPQSHMTLGDTANYVTHLGETSDVPVSATGGTCLGDDVLDIGSWAISDRPIAEQMALPMSGLVGEFDKADPANLARAVKFDLYLGFGVEARALLRAFPQTGATPDAWQAMAQILDDRTDTAQAFTGQSACDTAAALWALLASPDPEHEPVINTRAVVRAFSALPPHLRRLLGPRLTDRLLSIHEELAAHAVRDAITRLPGEKSAEVTLLEAKLDVAHGDLSAAEARLAPLAAQSGPASEDALADLVATTANNLKPIAPAQVDALAALAQERRDGPDAARFRAAVTLGRAAAGQFDEAFNSLADQPDLTERVWSILASLGTDDALVTHAVLSPAEAPPEAAAPAAAHIAERLLGLGFTDEAARWLALAPDADARLVARLALARRDGAAALQAVAGLADPEAGALKAESLGLTGNHRAAADLYQGLGDSGSYWRAESLASDWPAIAKDGPPPWGDAARSFLATPAAPADAKQPASGPLAQARAIVATSEVTRAAIGALLTAVPAPAVPTQ